MNNYETSAMVDGQGQIHLAVPFAPGAQVEVSIHPIEQTAEHADPSFAKDRAAKLLAALDKARNVESVGPLNRDRLYDRSVLR